MNDRTAAVVLAAGSGTRFGAPVSKVYVPLAGRPLLVWSLAVMEDCAVVDDIVVVIRDGDQQAFERAVDGIRTAKVRTVVTGALTRQGSEWAGIQAVRDRCGDIGLVLLHDAARPLVTTELVDRLVRRARAGGGGAIPTCPLEFDVVDQDGRGVPTADLVAIQTPQVFPLPLLLDVYPRATSDGLAAVDTCQAVRTYTDIPVHAVDSGPENLKITHPEDLVTAEALLAGRDDA